MLIVEGCYMSERLHRSMATLALDLFHAVSAALCC